jgi:hypothetical protein
VDPVPPPVPARNPPPRSYPKPIAPVSTTPKKPSGKVLKRFTKMFKSPFRNDTPQPTTSQEISHPSSDTSHSSPPQAQALRRAPIPFPRQGLSNENTGAIPKSTSTALPPPLYSTVVKNQAPGSPVRRSSQPMAIPPTTTSSEMPTERLRPRSLTDEHYALRPRSHPPNYKD